MLLYLEMKILNLYDEDLFIDEEIFNVDQSHQSANFRFTAILILYLD